MDIKDLAAKLDQFGEAQMTSIKNQAILENEVKNISKTMEKFADILSKQVEIETTQTAMKEDINFAFQSIRDIQEKGTKVCGHHNTQFAKYHEQCNMKSREFEKSIEELGSKIKLRDARFMKIATIVLSPIYLYLITKLLEM